MSVTRVALSDWNWGNSKINCNYSLYKFNIVISMRHLLLYQDITQLLCINCDYCHTIFLFSSFMLKHIKPLSTVIPPI